MISPNRPSIVAACMLLGWPGLASAQDHGADDHHDFHRNHASVTLGGMTPLEEKSETSFAIGAEYERRLDPRWGLGIGAEFTLGDHKRTALVAAGASYRLTSAWKVATGPGFEVVDKEQSDGTTKTDPFFVWWIGTGYEFHLGSLSLAPQLILDFVGETKTNLTYVVAVGTGF